MTITVNRKLQIGVVVGDITYKSFTVRPAILRDSIEAIEDLGAECSQARLRVAIEMRQTTFDDMPSEARNIDMFMSLCDKDYGIITDALNEVEKKLSAQSAP
ncbi:MAG: hypothetical protein Q7R66_18615 [Undibacterium sp.]|uniref:hypothetical protein n=1 Tax=Undibacterium sp. TaxID=1914977 RepID=UPI00271612A5|nr:hypothetical protein [Undibacterium sp.]MDO8654189.1 hypothetical protein [Undibacterium sp.]